MEQNDAKRAAQRVWGASPAGWTHASDQLIGTKEYFEQVVARRSGYEIPWLYDVFPFASSRNKHVLEVGCGAGYDAFEFCRQGAVYTGIDITLENIDRTTRHLSLYNLKGEIRAGDAEHLDFQDESFDLAFSNGVLHHVPDIEQSFREIRRVLKPGGELWLTLYHKHSFFYLISLGLWDHMICGGFLKETLQERLSRIETTTSDAKPLVHVYSRSEVKAMLERCGFKVCLLQVRKLVWEDLPGVPFIARFWRWIPQNLLEAVGRWLGWYVVVRAEKR
jgi:ubiquinone/menaquinone biosynthesis C-methylase UbiE